MDKVSYLLKKQSLKDNELKFSKEDFCFRCYRIQKNCLCQEIISFTPETELIILMHPMEAKKEKMGTGRITKAFLSNSHLIIGIDFTNDLILNKLLADKNYEHYLIYPGEKSINLSKEISETPLKTTKKKNRFIVIDGTWPCAKKMMKLSINLHSLPRVSFEVEKESLFDIKEQPAKYCLSTIESVHKIYDLLETHQIENLKGAHHQMLQAFKKLVDFQKACASNPDLPSYRKKKEGYSHKKDRAPAKKWDYRSIVFKD